MAYEDASQSAIVVINPIRGNTLGHETDDLAAGLTFQWQVTQQQGIPATWLLQYDALVNTPLIDVVKHQMQDQSLGQEFGLLFEIDKTQAQAAGVQFRGQGPWYGSDGLFLNSYDVLERRKLIDTAFGKFKDIFGYYPKTVGAWWIGGDSLSYMQRTYGITGALRAADQFDLDKYSIWGTPWDIPYLASSLNQGMPGKSFEESSKVVMLQWAVRDPLGGYHDPLLSLQDYGTKGYPHTYADHLASLFLTKPLGMMVMGLENGGAKEMFEGSYRTMLVNAKTMAQTYNAELLPAQEYAQKFLARQSVFAPKPYFLSNDYRSEDQSFWYISPLYRIAIHRKNGVVSIVDLRDYSMRLEEDFHILPNSQSTLRINEPFIVDTMRFPGGDIVLETNAEPLQLEESDQSMRLLSGDRTLGMFTRDTLTVYPETGEPVVLAFLETMPVPVVTILVFLYLGYFIFILFYRKHIRASLVDYALLLVPLFLAYPFLVSTTTFLFDKKEMPLLFLLAFLPVPSLLLVVYLVKLLPFIILFFGHYWFVLRSPSKAGTGVFACVYLVLLFLYIHIPYIPLDRTTYPIIAGCLGTVWALACVIAGIVIWKKRTKQIVLYALLGIVFIIGTSTVAVLFSRTKLALTLFEIQAYERVRAQAKQVIYEEEVDYGVLPIYKAVRPLLYKNYRLGETLTRKHWSVVQRPENNVLTLSDYDDQVIIVPRYLGTDLSGYEMETLGLTKTFDNAQIALFEKAP